MNAEPSAAPRSVFRAWLALLGLSLRRQARARQMLWVALGLLAIAVALVGLRTARGGWSTAYSRYSYSPPKSKLRLPGQRDKPKPTTPEKRVFTTYGRAIDQVTAAANVPIGLSPEDNALNNAVTIGVGAFHRRTDVVNFTRAIMFSLFIGFLLPVWCLSFATEPLGGERESRSLVWLLTRPIPRWSIFVGKYLALLPWAMSFTVGGFGFMCLAAGKTGQELFPRYWPAIAGGTLAFTSLFHLFSAATRRPTVVGLVYCFFLETMLGDMPGLMKRISISFYVRCVMFDAAADFGIQPDKPSVYQPVSGTTAWLVLAAVTVLALVIGAIVFSRAEYRDDGS